MKIALKMAALLMATLPVLSAAADSYPTRAVRLVIPYPPGGPVDVFARAMAHELALKWDQPVVIETKTGASEIVAARAVASAPADGYTLLLATEAALTLNPWVHKDLPYDPAKDFAPVVHLANTPFAFVVRPSFPAKTFEEFVEIVKGTPDKYTFGLGGVAGPIEFSYEDLAAAAGLQMLKIPYTGLGTVLPDVLGERVDSTLGGVSAIESLIKDGRLRALAFGGNKRTMVLPDVPTFLELGVEGVHVGFFSGLVAPAGTPEHIIEKISKDVTDVISAPDFQKQNYQPFGIEYMSSGPEEFKEFISRNREMQRLRAVRAGLIEN